MLSNETWERIIRIMESVDNILKGLIIGAILLALMIGTSQALFGWPN